MKSARAASLIQPLMIASVPAPTNRVQPAELSIREASSMTSIRVIGSASNPPSSAGAFILNNPPSCIARQPRSG
ncbi:MAG: hypothetical protein JO168_22740 [Solirubrobacterales bacterium]|nr:hypothetical protein [Solirubrobacterales bacterium]MBV9717404.1 hypothetical protein [Solirubrobacterales bacterium]